MKKAYVKPDAEYINFMSRTALAAGYRDDEDVEMGTSDAGDGGWDEL